MQGHIVLKNFFSLPPAHRPKQKKTERKKTHRARETKQKQAHNFLEQNKLLGTARRKKNPIFNVNLQFHILLALLGYKKINIFLNKTSRKKK